MKPEVWVLDNGVSRLNEYIIIAEDNTEFNLSAAFREHHIKLKTYQMLEQHGVKITSNHQGLYEE
jgi:hypothetical protein